MYKTQKFPCHCGPGGLDTHLKKDHTWSHAHAYSYKIILNRDMLNLFKHTPLVQGFKQVQRGCRRYGDAVNPQALSNLILLSLPLSLMALILALPHPIIQLNCLISSQIY